MNDYAKQIIESIQANQNADKARWLENYVKHDIKSFGVGIPEIREIIIQFEKDTALNISSTQVQIEFLNELMRNDHCEPKLSAILFVQLYWKSMNAADILKLSSSWFDNKWITDWNVCDWLCVRLLTPLLDKEPELAVSILREWNKSQNPWKARASLVSFAQSKKIERHTETILQFSAELIKRHERFCKTAVGWVLREYSKIDDTFVTGFLEKYSDWTTKEVIKNATKYIGQK
jgi:3-methyladenine DNA glycosylase AlkD